MKLMLSALFGLLISCGSQDLSLTSNQKIIEGERCGAREFPAALEIVELNGSGYTTPCGATLIAPDIVLTAAHCIKNPTGKLYVTAQADLRQVSFDEFLPSSRTMIRVKSAFIHSNYDDFKTHGPHHDIALLFLERQSKITPAEIASQSEVELRPGISTHIVGWGQRETGNSKTVRTEPIKHCAHSFINDVTALEIQLGSSQYSARKCFGDSGGGTYAQVGSTPIGTLPVYKLIGITSHGKAADTNCEKGGFDTRIDAYLDWIEETIQYACSTGERLFCG